MLKVTSDLAFEVAGSEGHFLRNLWSQSTNMRHWAHAISAFGLARFAGAVHFIFRFHDFTGRRCIDALASNHGNILVVPNRS